MAEQACFNCLRFTNTVLGIRRRAIGRSRSHRCTAQAAESPSGRCKVSMAPKSTHGTLPDASFAILSNFAGLSAGDLAPLISRVPASPDQASVDTTQRTCPLKFDLRTLALQVGSYCTCTARLKLRGLYRNFGRLAAVSIRQAGPRPTQAGIAYSRQLRGPAGA